MTRVHSPAADSSSMPVVRLFELFSHTMGNRLLAGPLDATTACSAAMAGALRAKRSKVRRCALLT